MPNEHRYRTRVVWTGNLGSGTREYRGYGRGHDLEIPGAPLIRATSGLGPRRDPGAVDPEELLVAALSSCHMLWYLHLCSSEGVVVTAYSDEAEGVLTTEADGGGRMTRVTLRPQVTISEGPAEAATRLHDEAHRKCFISNSVNFPVACEPALRVLPASERTT